MHTLVYEFMLSLRRLGRRPAQSGMMLATFTVSITLSLVSWSLYHTMFLKQPDFDPAGRLASIPSLFRLRRINPADCLRSL